MAENVGLPEGFVLDEAGGLPEGFVLDAPDAPKPMGVGEDMARSALSGAVMSLPNAIDFGGAVVATVADKALGVSGKPVMETFSQYNAQRPVSKSVDAMLGTKQHEPQTWQGSVAEIGGGLLGGGVGGKIAESLTEKAMRVMGKPVRMVTQPMKKDFAPALIGKEATEIDPVGKFSQVQRTLGEKYGELRGAEKQAWDAVRSQSAGKGVQAGSLKSLQEDIMRAQGTLTDNEAAGVVDRILGRWNKFASEGTSVPAEELIANRATLSKASTKNAGLRPVVEKMDETLEGLGIKGMKDAIGLSRKRFQEFDDIKPIAEALGEYSTAADFGRAVFGAGSPSEATKAAQRVKEVMRAAGDRHVEVKQALDQAVVHRIMQQATSGGDETVWLDKGFREINKLRQKNPELWGMLSKDTQEGLLKLGAAMNDAGKSGKLEKASVWTLWGLNKALSPFGVRQVIQKPSTTASQVRVDFDTVKKMMNLRPDEGRSMLDKLLGK